MLMRSLAPITRPLALLALFAAPIRVVAALRPAPVAFRKSLRSRESFDMKCSFIRAHGGPRSHETALAVSPIELFSQAFASVSKSCRENHPGEALALNRACPKV